MLRGVTELAIALVAVVGVSQPAKADLPNGFAEESMASGLEFPVGFALLPDGRALIVEQYSAKVKLAENKVVTTVADIPNVSTFGERGLQGIAIDPEWPERPYVYIHYTAASPPSVKISRFTVTGDLEGGGFAPLVVDTASRYDVLADIDDNAHVHQGGTIRFGQNKLMFVSLGEDDDACVAQDLTKLGGSILRLDVSNLPPGPGGPANKADITPNNNPFESSPNENARLIWAYGLRNVFRFAIDSKRNDLYMADVGAVTFEEINFAARGGMNFGWPWLEGTTPWSTCAGGPGTFVDPIFGYAHGATGPSAIIAAVLYRKDGNQQFEFPQNYEGDFFYCDYYSGEMVRMTLHQGGWQIADPVAGQPSATVWGNGFNGATDFQVGPEGGVWYTSHLTGQLRRISFYQGAVDVPVVQRAPIPTPLYFDIQGRRIDRPGASGVYFVRGSKDGRSKKIILK